MIKSEINKEAYRLLQKNLTDRKLLKSLSISQKKMLQLIKDGNWTDKIDFILRAKQQGYFKICPICYKEEIEDYGEVYLHRIHQIPEVFICSKHQVPLKISMQPIYYYGKNSYVPLLEIEFKDNIANDLFINNLEHFLAINKYIEYLLSNEVSNKDYLWITDQYKNRLSELCLCTPSGRVNIDEVENRFIKFYGEEFLKLFAKG